MGTFRCTTCGASSDQAASCDACGGRTFVLSRDQHVTATHMLAVPPRGQLVSIADAPSLRRARRRKELAG